MFGGVFAGVFDRVFDIPARRLTLVPQTAAHASEMFRVLSDPALHESGIEPPRSLAGLRSRFLRLEARRSPGGSEQWLNWVIRLGPSELIGSVQATVFGTSSAAIAYELASAHWGRGLASEAVRAMIGELVSRYHVGEFAAVVKLGNTRSLRLLERLGFGPADAGQTAQARIEPGACLMLRAA